MGEFLNVDVDLSTVERAVSPKTYDAGTGYARERAARAIIWNPEDGLMRGIRRAPGQVCREPVQLRRPRRLQPYRGARPCRVAARSDKAEDD